MHAGRTGHAPPTRGLRRAAAPLLGALAASLIAACASTPPTKPVASSTRPEKLDAPVACTPITTPTSGAEAWKARLASLEALVSGDPSSARDGFAAMLETKPADIGAFALHAASENVLTRQAEQSNIERSRLRPVQIPGESGGKPHVFGGARPTLHVLKSEPTDGSFERLGLRDPSRLDASASSVAPFRDQGLSRQIAFADHVVSVFGDALVVVAPVSGSPARALDVHNLVPQGLSVVYGQVVDRVLVLLVSDGETALMTAVDLEEKRALWHTERGTISGVSFAVSGGYAFVGGVREQGGIATVDLATGKILERVALDFSPGVVLVKDGVVHAMDAAQSVLVDLGPAAGTPLPPALPSGLPGGSAPDATDVPLRVCQYARALDAIDARDVDRAVRETSVFVDPDDPPARALSATADFIRRVKTAPNTTTDLSTAPVVALEVPRAEAFSTAPRRTLGKVPSVRSTKPPPAPKKPQSRTPGPVKPAQPTPPPVRDDVDVARVMELSASPPTTDSPPQPPFELPASYGLVALQRSLAFFRPSGSKPATWNVGLYGGSYLAILGDQRVTTMFDLRAFTARNKSVLDVAIVGDTLVLAIGEFGQPEGPSGYVAGYAVDTGALRFRSASGVATTNLLVAGDYILAGRTKATNDGQLNVLRSDTGETEATVSTECSFQSIAWSGPDLVATCDTGWELFNVER